MDVINYIQGQILNEKVIIDLTWFLLHLFFDVSIGILHMKSATLPLHIIIFPFMLLFSHKTHKCLWDERNMKFCDRKLLFWKHNVNRNILKDILWIWILVLMII